VRLRATGTTQTATRIPPSSQVATVRTRTVGWGRQTSGNFYIKVERINGLSYGYISTLDVAYVKVKY